MTSADGPEGSEDGETPAKEGSADSGRTADGEVSEGAGELAGAEVPDEGAADSGRTADAGTPEDAGVTGKRAGSAGEGSASEDAEGTATAPGADAPRTPKLP